MRVFVTGATGFIGSVLVPELLNAGHQVLGLARSEGTAASLVRVGAQVQRGSLQDLDSLRAGADATDGVLHLGFGHDFGELATAVENDRRAIEAMGQVLAGSGRPFVGTTGTMLLAPGQVGTEDDPGSMQAPATFRVPNENLVLALAHQGVRACVVRLSPVVHGPGDKGFVSFLMNAAREKGVSAYVGEGLNRWPAVHRLDAAYLFRLALERGQAGARYHGVAELVPLRAIAETIGQGLNLPVQSLAPPEAAAHFSEWLSLLVEADNPASSALTQERLGWQSSQIGLLEDMQQNYFGQ